MELLQFASAFEKRFFLNETKFILFFNVYDHARIHLSQGM